MEAGPSEERKRFLTPEEIEYIVSVIVAPRGPMPEILEAAKHSMRHEFTLLLKHKKINPRGIEELRNRILIAYQKAQVVPGKPAGMQTAEALSQPLMQTTLNTFKHAGSSKNIAGDIRQIESILRNNNPRQTFYTIVFKGIVTYEQIYLKKRPNIIELKMEDVMDTAATDPWLIDNTLSFFDGKVPYWYYTYNALVKNVSTVIKQIQDKTNKFWFMRMRLNVDRLYDRDVKMEDIVEIIIRKTQERTNGETPIDIIYSPVMEEEQEREVIGETGRETFTDKFPVVYIDVYPSQEFFEEELERAASIARDNAGLLFLSTTFLSTISDTLLKGIDGIQDLYIVESPVWQIVKDEYQNPDKFDEWTLTLDQDRLRITGINPNHLANLCRISGMEVLSVSDVEVKVRLPKTKPGDLDIILEVKPTKIKSYNTPTNWINYQIKKDELDQKARGEAIENEFNELKRTDPKAASKLIFDVNMGKVKEASLFIYADAESKKMEAKEYKRIFRHLLNMIGVDPYHTSTTHVDSVLSVLGIEPARTLLIQRITNIIAANGSYIDPRHILLLVDYMTHHGFIAGIDYHGVKKQGTDFMALATYERSFQIMAEAAPVGEIISARSVSTSILTGRRADIGTAFTNLGVSAEDRKEANRLARQSVPAPVDETALISAVRKVMTTVSGIEPANDVDGRNLPLTGPSEPQPGPITGPLDNIGPIPPIVKPEAPVSNLLAGVAEQSQSVVCAPPVPPDIITINSTPGSIPSMSLSGEESTPAISVSVEMPESNRGVDAPPILDELFSQVTGATPNIISPPETRESTVGPPPLPTLIPSEDIGISHTTTRTAIRPVTSSFRPPISATRQPFMPPTMVPGLARFVSAPARILIPLVPFIKPRPLPIPHPIYLTYKPLDIRLV